MLKNNIMGELLDVIKTKLLSSKFTVGQRCEMYAPAAKELVRVYGAKFHDSKGYSFTVTLVHANMLWTNDITYGKNIEGEASPPPHHTYGVPIPSVINRFIRPVTGE